jgi:hypothetical protein
VAQAVGLKFKPQYRKKKKKKAMAGCRWLVPVILATWEAEIRRIAAEGQPRQILHKTLISKNNEAK